MGRLGGVIGGEAGGGLGRLIGSAVGGKRGGDSGAKIGSVAGNIAGGLFPFFAKGGKVPGVGPKLAVVHGGEVVVAKKYVKKIPKAIMTAMKKDKMKK